jgi:hypothetical protein
MIVVSFSMLPMNGIDICDHFVFHEPHCVSPDTIEGCYNPGVHLLAMLRLGIPTSFSASHSANKRPVLRLVASGLSTIHRNSHELIQVHP